MIVILRFKLNLFVVLISMLLLGLMMPVSAKSWQQAKGL